MRRLSYDVEGRKVSIENSNDLQNSLLQTNSARTDSQFFQPGKYIACIYDQQWHIGIIMKRSEEENDVYVKFMKRNSNDVLSWPQNTNDECWIPFQNVLCFISAPEPQGHSGRNYRISSSDKDLILSIITNE